MFALVFISIILLYGFIFLGVRVFGLLNSYSAYASKWTEKVPIDNMHLWSIVTIAAAILMIPPMIEVGLGSTLQFLGFFVPAYLICVGLTPTWESNRKEHVYHSVFAVLCAIGALCWIVFVANIWYIALPPLITFAVLMMYTGRYNAYIFWGEMVMFTSAHLALMLSL